MRLIDLDDPKTIHLICNLEPKWKPMAKFNSSTELYEELESVMEAFNQLPAVELEQMDILKELDSAKATIRSLTAKVMEQDQQLKAWEKFAPFLAAHGMLRTSE